MDHTSGPEETLSLKDVQIKVDNYFLTQTGLVKNQSLLKIGEYNLMVVPAVLGLGGGSLLVALTASEVTLFSRFMPQLHTLTLGFQALENEDIQRLHIRVVIEAITPVTGNKDLCLLKMKFKTVPGGFQELMSRYHSEQQVRKNYFQQTQGELIEIKPANIALLGYNGYCEAFIQESVRVALRGISVKQAVLASSQGWKEIKKGDTFSLKLYFKKYQFFLEAVMEDLPENPRGEAKVSLGFSNELLDIMEDYQFKLTMLKKEGCRREETMKLVFLGTGTSTGVPTLGCGCPVCRSSDPRDNRMRSSLLVQGEKTTIVVDTGPEFRVQALRQGIDSLDGVLLTHPHADHVHGLDDVRPLTYGSPLRVWSSATTVEAVKRLFPYFFLPPTPGTTVPNLVLETAVPGLPFKVGTLEVLPLEVFHGKMPILGFRFGKSGLPDRLLLYTGGVFSLAEGFGCFGFRQPEGTPPTPHFCEAQAAEAAGRIGAARTYFTHINHDSSHQDILSRLPAGMEPAYDGLEVVVSDGG